LHLSILYIFICTIIITFYMFFFCKRSHNSYLKDALNNASVLINIITLTVYIICRLVLVIGITVSSRCFNSYHIIKTNTNIVIAIN